MKKKATRPKTIDSSAGSGAALADATSLSLDQLRTLVAVVEEGNFSAAARRLSRVQSAVSHSILQLELATKVTLFDRATRIPTLTAQGALVLAHARRVIAEVDALMQTLRHQHQGHEALVKVAIDAFFPTSALTQVCLRFRRIFPSTELRLEVDTLSAISRRVRLGCHFGVGLRDADAKGLLREHAGTILLVPVVSKSHSLAAAKGKIPQATLERETQIVLSEDLGLEDQSNEEHGVLSPLVWRVADLSTKHAMIASGLGFGNLPEPMVRQELQDGALVRIHPAPWSGDEFRLSFSLLRAPEQALGPAAQWLYEALRDACENV